jgi:integrase
MKNGKNRKVRVPKYRKGSRDEAFAEYRGRRYYLGRYGSQDSRDRYRAFLARIAAEPEPLKIDPGRELTVVRLVALWLDHCKKYYVDQDGKPHKEYSSNVEAMRVVLELYGREPARLFSPRWLKALQKAYIQKDYARSTINAHVARVKRFIGWCCSEEYLPATVYHGLLCVPALRKGKTEARESKDVRPVEWSVVETTLRFTSPIVAAMIQVQWLCGMRPAEVCRMRPMDIDRSGRIWLYVPARHKNSWRGTRLVKAIPQRAQEILAPFLNRPSDSYLFSPQESEKWKYDQIAAAAGKKRKTKVYPSERRRRDKARALTAKRTSRCKDHYDTNSYARAIRYAIGKALADDVMIQHWSPNQLRHGIATELARTLGQQKAQRWLGHDHLDTTSIYAEITTQELVAIAEELDTRWQQLRLQVPPEEQTRAAI